MSNWVNFIKKVPINMGFLNAKSFKAKYFFTSYSKVDFFSSEKQASLFFCFLAFIDVIFNCLLALFFCLFFEKKSVPGNKHMESLFKLKKNQ